MCVGAGANRNSTNFKQVHKCHDSHGRVCLMFLEAPDNITTLQQLQRLNHSAK